MPMVKIYILEGKTLEYKKAVLKGVQNALIDAIGISENDNFQRLHELESENYIYPPDRTENTTTIEITLFPGRSNEAKRDLYTKIVQNLAENPGIDGNDVMIVLYEPPMENWGVRGGKPACDVDFDFKIDI